MRKFSMVVLDAADKIIDRIEMDIISSIEGLGYTLNLSLIKTDVEDYVTKIVQQKKKLKLKQLYVNGYNGMQVFNAWILSHVEDTMCLEYNDGSSLLYCEVKVTDSSYSQLNVYKVLEQTLEIQPLTPFFTRIENKIRIQVSSVGKCYPFHYPYCYGLNLIENNEVDNVYFREVPIIVTLYGPLVNPHISLFDDKEEVYNEILFDNVYLLEGQQLIINSAQKKIWFVDANGNYEDYYFKVNGAYDSYLRAKGGVLSHLNLNIAEQKGYLIGSWRQYKL